MTARKSKATFAERIVSVWGGLDEIIQAADDPDAALADFFQVTPEQLRAWRDAEGRHKCPVMAARGNRCRNYTSTLVDYDPRVWLSRSPVFCRSHMPAEPAFAPRSEDPAVVVPQAAHGSITTEDDGAAPAR